MAGAEKIVWHGAEALRQHLVPISDIKENPDNPRRGDVPSLVESLRRFGQTHAVTLASDGVTLVAGQARRRAALELGWTHLAAIPAEFSDDAEERAFLVADNRLGQLGFFDDEQLMLRFDEMEVGGLHGTGFTIDDVEDLRARLGQVATTEPVAQPTWSFAEDEETQQRRQEAYMAALAKKEVVLMLEDEEYRAFGEALRTLMPDYGTSSVKDTIVKAVEREAERARIEREG